MKRLFSILLLLFSLNLTGQVCYTNYPLSANLDTYKLRGQSNALGNCPIANLQSDLIGTITNAKIFVRTTDSDFSGTWQNLQSNVNNSGNLANTGTFGIELRLMKLLVAQYNGTQKLFKYGYGGTSLNTAWFPGLGPSYMSASTGFKNGVVSYNSTFSTYQGTKAEIWIQGEADTDTAPHAASYQTNLTNFINRTRQDQQQLTLPIIIVSLSVNQSSFDATNLATIRTAQRAVAQYVYTAATGITTTQSGGSVIPGVWFIDHSELTFDGAHYTATGYDNIAHYVFNVILQL